MRVVLFLRHGGAKTPCKWGCESEIYTQSLFYSVKVFDNLVDLWFQRCYSKGVVCFKTIARSCVICGMDIQPNICYTCHGDSSLYVVIILVFYTFSMTAKSTFCKRGHFILSLIIQSLAVMLVIVSEKILRMVSHKRLTSFLRV